MNLPRSKRLNPVSPKKRRRSGIVGKAGIVRLYGLALRELRLCCWLRDKGVFQGCGVSVSMDDAFGATRMEMSHIRAKRNNGDTLANVTTLCPECHRKSHNAGGKPVPRKENK